MKKIVQLLLLSAACCFAEISPPGNAAYVVDNGSGQLWIVDLGRKQIDSVVPLGSGASELLILPNNHFGFVSNYDDGTISVIDLWTNTLKTTIQVSEGLGVSSLAATPDGLLVYVTNLEDSTVRVIDATTLSVVASIAVGRTPVQVNVGPGGRFAYVVNQTDNTVSVIDVNRNEVADTLTVGVQPNQFAILPNRDIAYVVNKGSNDLTLVDLATNEVVGSPVPVGSAPVSVAYSSDSSRLYVVNSGSNNISVVDTAINRQIAVVSTGSQPVAMTVTFDSMFAYVSNQGGGTVSVLDLSQNTREIDIATGSQPFSLAFDPNEDYLFVTNMGSNKVTIIDVARDTRIGDIAGPSPGGVPVQFALLHAPTLLETAPNPAPGGGMVVLTGDGFMPGSQMRVSPAASGPFTVAPLSVDSQVLEAALPSYQDSDATVDVVNGDGNSSERINLRTGVAAPVIEAGGIRVAAGLTGAPPPISGNALLAISGHFPEMMNAASPAYTFPLPRSLGNAKVSFNGAPAPMLSTFSLGDYNQIYVLAPVSLFARNAVRVSVTIGDQTSPAEPVSVAPASPGIPTVSWGDSSAAVTHADWSLVTTANPAVPGETVVLFMTGLGNTTPPPVEGEAAPVDVLSPTVLTVSVLVGGVEATSIPFSGLTPTASGLYQVNFQVPLSLAGAGEVDIQVQAGRQSSNIAKMAVR